MDFKIYHNPKCSKSRETLKLLNDKGIEPEIILYLENPPSASELTAVLNKLEMEARQLIRFKEPIAEELGISPTDDRPDAEWVCLMIENPILIERPIVVASKKAAIGRPPEKVLQLIKNP